MRCPNCSSDKLVAIRMSLDTGPVLFRSCRGCEHKWWESEAGCERLALATVLEMARVRKSA